MDSVAQKTVVRYWGQSPAEICDTLAVEEPLEIRVNNERFSVTMRTPGADFELVRGLLLTEGLIGSNADIGRIAYCDVAESEGMDSDNIVTVHLSAEAASGRRWQRTLMSGTSCGLCGKSAIDAVSTGARPIDNRHGFPIATLRNLPEQLRLHQPLFDATGGLHAAGLFASNGDCLAAFEDIGRHNATDKAIGRGVAEGWLPWTGADSLALLVSGRASFEIAQKAVMAGIPLVCSVSAASALAAELAEANGQTLVGFLRGGGMTVYTGQARLLENAEASV